MLFVVKEILIYLARIYIGNILKSLSHKEDMQPKGVKKITLHWCINQAVDG